MRTRSRNTHASVRNEREEASPVRRPGKEPLEKSASNSHGEGTNHPSSHRTESSQQLDLNEAVKLFLAEKQDEFLTFLQTSQKPEKKTADSPSPSRHESHYRSKKTADPPSPSRHESHYRSSDVSSRRRNSHHQHVPSPPRNRNHRRTPSPPRRRNVGFAVYGALRTPFSDDITRTPLPSNYRTPSMTYDGLVDPHDFLGRYQYNMANQGLNEVHMCKLFPELLIGNARRWFDSLPQGSIRSYRDLMDAFHRRFFQKAEARITSAQLLSIRQGRDEKISDFMTRFHKECLQVDDLNDLLVISAFQNGILPGALYRKLVECGPQTAQEMWDIADQFARADEADRRKRSLDSSSRGDKKKPDHSDQGLPRRTPFERIQRAPVQGRLGPRLNPEKPPAQFVPLNKSRAEIFELHSDMFEKPKSMTKSAARRDQDKYCSFHQDHGHDTEECRNLAADIDVLVKAGTLKKYQSKPPKKNKKQRGTNCAPHDPKRQQDPEDDDEQQYDGVIQTIDALPAGKTKSSLKSERRGFNREEPTHKRLKEGEVITFSDADPVPAISPHQDAIVIQAGVANKLVHRVFVDTGASVSILFKECFDKLEVDPARLSPAPLPLKSFAQEDTRPEGIISLPITVGKAPTSSSTVIEFFVVKARSPYNIILGRDWLNTVRAVCSTYHLTIKIPTKGGIAVIRGDQKRAKECLQVALKSAEQSDRHHQA